MALTRRLLKGMGLTDEQMDTIIESHADTVEGLKAELAKYKADAEKLPQVQQELDALKAAGDGGWEEKARDWERKYPQLVTENTEKEAKAAKEKAVRAYYESKGITGKSLDIAMRGSGAEIAAIELENDQIKDASALDALISGDFAGLVSTTQTRGAQVTTPPANNSGNTMTKAEIYKKDDHGHYILSAAERQQALMDNQIY